MYPLIKDRAIVIYGLEIKDKMDMTILISTKFIVIKDGTTTKIEVKVTFVQAMV